MPAVLPDTEPTPDELDALEHEDLETLDVPALLERIDDEPLPVPLALEDRNRDALRTALLANLQPRTRLPRDGWSVMACDGDPDPDRWFPNVRGRHNRERAEAALRTVCRGCPSRVACLLESIDHEEPTTIDSGGAFMGGASGTDRGTLLDAIAAGGRSGFLLRDLLAAGRDPHQLAVQLRDEWEQAA